MHLTLTLAVSDLERTAEFYGDLLGRRPERFAPAADQDDLLLLACGDATILFRRDETLAALHPALFQNLDRHPRGVGMALELPVADLDAAIAAIERRSRPVLYELEDRQSASRELWLHDPDGYLVMLVERIETA